MIQNQSTSPRKNLFEENRLLHHELRELRESNDDLKQKLNNCQSICYSIIDAVSRVYSEEAAQELVKIIRDCEGNVEQMGNTIYEAMATHQSHPTVSDWSQSQRKTLRTP